MLKLLLQAFETPSNECWSQELSGQKKLNKLRALLRLSNSKDKASLDLAVHCVKTRVAQNF